MIEFVFAIPAPNAFWESLFSHMKFLWNNNRHETRFSWGGIKNSNEHSFNLYRVL
jgi:hypothetical protein